MFDQINTITTKSGFDSTYYISKSGLRVKQAADSFLVGGYSCEKDADLSIIKSKYEVLERLLAFDFMININGFEADSDYYLEDIALQKGNDASGLSIHPKKEDAIECAYNELIERHLLSKIWYHNDISLHMEVDQVKTKWSRYFLSLRVNKKAFSICVLYNDVSHNIFCGSSVRKHLSYAKEKSYSEALMLLHGVLEIQGSSANGFTDNTRDRMYSLTSPQLSRDRLKHFIRNTTEVDSTIEVPLQDINVVEINTGLDNAFLYRAISSSLLKIREQRKLFPQTVMDPFC